MIRILEWLSFKGGHSIFKSLNFEADQDNLKIFVISKEMRLTDKCPDNFLIPFYWTDFEEKMGKYM